MKIFDLKKYKETYLKPTIINLLKTKDNEKVFKAERRDILVLVEKIYNSQYLIRNCGIRKELAHFSSAGGEKQLSAPDS